MKTPIFYLLLAIGALGGSACEKLAAPDEPRPTAVPNPQHVVAPDKAIIGDTRTWFEARLDNPTVLDVSVAYTKPLNWDWANVEHVSYENTLITVPEEDYFTRPIYAPGMSPNGCRSLVFIRNSKGEYRTVIMEFRPDREYIIEQVDLYGYDPLNPRPIIHPGDYTGYVLYYDGVTGKLTQAVRYDQGTAMHDLQIPT